MANELTQIIQLWHQGDVSAKESLYKFAYLQLMDIARRERSKLEQKHGTENILVDEEVYNTTSLIHEAYLKLESLDEAYIANRRQFYLMISKIMKQVLFDAARKKTASKRQVSSMEDDACPDNKMLHASKLFEAFDHKYERQAEVLQLKYFMGLDNSEIANILECSQSLIEKDVRFGKSWMKMNLTTST